MYNQTISDIQVFKTNIQDISDLEKIATVLNNESRIKHWNVDLADVDKVLRVQSDELSSEDITHLITQADFCCEELPD